MNSDRKNKNPDSIDFKSFFPFLLITFFIAWMILALYIFQSEMMTRLFGPLSGTHPLFFLAVWAPAIAASLIVGIKSGLSGLGRFFSKIRRWRTGFGWYLFLIIGVPVVFYAGAALKGSLFTDPFPPGTLQAAVIAILFGLVKGPIEEFGWRGFALPLLQRKMAPVWAGLLLGIIWGFWHLPAFLISGTQQSAWAFFPFFLGTIVISLIVTALYNDSKGSILLAALLHFQLMNPVWPEAQPYDTYLLAVVAIVILWMHRHRMFSKSAGMTEIVPLPGEELTGHTETAKVPKPL